MIRSKKRTGRKYTHEFVLDSFFHFISAFGHDLEIGEEIYVR
jgi:hypothetical protein